MVEGKIFKRLSSFLADITIDRTKFIAENSGKLRDYYRIGKLLGSGKIKMGNDIQALSVRSDSVSTGNPVRNARSRSCERVKWIPTRRRCCSTRSTS